MNRLMSVTIFGVLNVVFAILGGAGLTITALAFAAARNPQAPNPVLEIMDEHPAFKAYHYVMTGVGFVFVLVLLYAGIGLLQMKSWGRTLSILYSVFAMASWWLGLVLNYFVLFIPLMDQVAKLPPGPEKAGAMGSVITGVLGCGGMIYPLVMLIFMCRPNVVAAFRAASGADSPFGVKPIFPPDDSGPPSDPPGE